MTVIIGCHGIRTISICVFRRAFNFSFTRYVRSSISGRILGNGKQEPGSSTIHIWAHSCPSTLLTLCAVGNRKSLLWLRQHLEACPVAACCSFHFIIRCTISSMCLVKSQQSAFFCSLWLLYGNMIAKVTDTRHRRNQAFCRNCWWPIWSGTTWYFLALSSSSIRKIWFRSVCMRKLAIAMKRCQCIPYWRYKFEFGYYREEELNRLASISDTPTSEVLMCGRLRWKILRFSLFAWRQGTQRRQLLVHNMRYAFRVSEALKHDAKPIRITLFLFSPGIAPNILWSFQLSPTLRSWYSVHFISITTRISTSWTKTNAEN